jgi:hypothetical protein
MSVLHRAGGDVGLGTGGLAPKSGIVLDFFRQIPLTVRRSFGHD